MRVGPAILAVSLAANAAWALTSALAKPSRPVADERADETPATSPTPGVAETGLAVPASRASATPRAPAVKPYTPPWVLPSPPPALGPAPAVAPGAYVRLPAAPEDRLAARLGRTPTSDELAALDTMMREYASDSADQVAREVAARRGRDEALSHPAGPLIDRLKQGRDAKKKDGGIEELLDFLASVDFEAAFPARGHGPTMAWEDVKSARVRTAPVDGTTLTLGAGEHEFAFHAGEREFEYHPFPRDVTLVGAGPSKTLLRIRRAWRTTGPVVNFGFADMSIAIESSSVLESRTGDAVCLHFSNCRISAPDGIEFRNAGALWLDGCESDGTWGGRAKQAVVGKANDALVRFDRCVVTLCPPFESRNVLAVFLKGCTIREQGRAAETEGVNVRLVATTVDRLASWDDWRKRAAVPRQFTIDGDSKRRR